jgi:glycine hydroxymethyltransferase
MKLPHKFAHLKKQDRALARLVSAELERQERTIDLIPSENFAPLSVLELLGSPLVNKYSEGYPGKRYYPGNRFIDEIEELAKSRALKTFHLSPREWSVNVQPYSGSPANIEIYSALMDVGDVFLGMALASGGHLTHGHRVNFSGKAWRAVQYGVDLKTGRIDYGEVARLAKRHRPKVIVSGATAYPRKIDFSKFARIARSVKAFHVADISHIAGLVVAGLHPSPFRDADVVMTTTHKTLRGPRGAVIFMRKLLEERINRAVFPGFQGGPHDNVTAAIAAMFGEVMRPDFKRYQRQIIKNASALAAELKKRGATLITGGTENHLLLVDARKSYGIDGAEAERRLEAVGIIANRNSIPGDTSPFRPSGIRMGTPAVTSRGMRGREMRLLAEFVHATLTQTMSRGVIASAVQRLIQRGGTR